MDEERELALEMIRAWESKLGRVKLDEKLLKVLPIVLKNQFKNALIRWDSYCKAIKNSPHLVNGDRGKTVDIVWALQDQNIDKVRNGFYAAHVRAPQGSFSDQPLSEEDKMFREELLKNISPGELKMWFKDVHLKARRVVGCTPRVILMVFVPKPYMVTTMPKYPVSKALDVVGSKIDENYYSFEIVHTDYHFEQNHYFS